MSFVARVNTAESNWLHLISATQSRTAWSKSQTLTEDIVFTLYTVIPECVVLVSTLL